MARSNKQFLSIKFDNTDFKKIDAKLAEAMMAAKPKVNKKVTETVFNAINASDYVPFDTGNLKSESNVFKDRYDPVAYTMGWHTPYAKTMFYGVKSIKEWKTQDGKRKAFYASKSGIPFWTHPFVKNKSYMMGLYSKYAKEAFK